MWPRSLPPTEMVMRITQNLYVNDCSCVICNCPKIETTWIVRKWPVDRRAVAHPYDEIPLHNEHKWIPDTCNNVGESQMPSAKSKKPDSSLLAEWFHLTFWKRWNYEDRKLISACQTSELKIWATWSLWASVSSCVKWGWLYPPLKVLWVLNAKLYEIFGKLPSSRNVHFLRLPFSCFWNIALLDLLTKINDY